MVLAQVGRRKILQGEEMTFDPVSALIEWGYAQNRFHATGMLNKSPFVKAGTKMDPDKLKNWAKRYRGWRDIDPPKESKEAAKLATEGKVP